jgi:hypothetical protein
MKPRHARELLELKELQERNEIILRRSKRASCLAVGGTLLFTCSISVNRDFYGLYGELALILMWTANYLVITASLAANQRLVLLSWLAERGDFEGVQRVIAIPANLHMLALLVFDDPGKLYGRWINDD